MFLPYQSDQPDNCEKHGFRYSMSNCVFEAAFEVSSFFSPLSLISWLCCCRLLHSKISTFRWISLRAFSNRVMYS